MVMLVAVKGVGDMDPPCVSTSGCRVGLKFPVSTGYINATNLGIEF